MRFSVVIHKDKDSDYGVTVPDLPGCFSAGESLEEALEEAGEAIECHLEGMLIDGEPLPEPKDIMDHRKNPDFKDGIWAIVGVDVSRLSGKAKRINIALPERLLAQIDNYAKKSGETRSGLITHAIMEYISSDR